MATTDPIRARLNRIEGQVRGIARMVDEDAYCIDVLTQISATTRALESVGVKLIEEHLNSCVSEALKNGEDPDVKIKEATQAIARFVKS